MKTRLHPIEEQIERADRRGRAIRFLKHTATLACVAAGVFLLMGIAAALGWITSMSFAIVVLAIGSTMCLFAWAVIALLVWASPAKRPEVAAAIEAAHPSLLDRLNTLAHLERAAPDSAMIAPIASQAANVLAKRPPDAPFHSRLAWLHWAAFAGLFLLTLLFYRWSQPLERIRAAELAEQTSVTSPQRFALPPDETHEEQAAAEEQTWGEVNISEPGADIRAAEFEIIPLQIEASASQPLTEVKLVSSVNGGQLGELIFPPPQDPTYAIYPTELVLPSLNVKLWDVIAYYARATAADGSTYASDLYFVEVFPLSDEWDELPGGKNGLLYRKLQELTALTERQQDIVRAQHRLDQLPSSEAARRELGYQQLAIDEERLMKAAARVAAGNRVQWQHDKDLKEWLDEFDQAVRALEQAQQALKDAGAEANPQQATQQALKQLVANRANLHQLAQRIPEKFAKGTQLAGDQQEAQRVPPPTAEQLQAAREQVEELAAEQKAIAEQALITPPDQLTDEQQRVQQELGEMPENKPEATSAVAEPFISTYEAAAESQKKLEKSKTDAQPSAEHAAKQAQEFARQLEQRELLEELAQQLQKLTQIQQQPENFDDSAMKQEAARSDELLEKLDEFAAKSPQHTEQLKQQLTEPNQRESLNSACQKMGNCKSNGEKSAAAGAAEQGLQQLAQALQADHAQAGADQHHQNLDRELNGMEAANSALGSTRNDVRKMLSTQRDLQKKSSRNDVGTLQQLAASQQQNEKDFQAAAKQHQDTLSNVPEETQFANNALQSATEAMSQGAAGHERAEQAGNALQDLDSSLEQLERFGNMSDAFRLQELTRRHLRQLQNMQQRPENYSQEQFQQAAEDSQRIAELAQRLGQTPGVKESFGQDMANAMNQQQLDQIRQATSALKTATSNDQRQTSLQQIRDQLRSLSNCIGNSGTASTSEGQDSLRESGYEALARALRELETLSKQSQNPSPLTPQQESRLRADALEQLMAGIFGIYGHNERTEQITSELENQLVDQKAPVDQETIRQLMSDIQHLRRENASNDPQTEDSAELSNVDSSRLPPQYRQAIERYFQKLSEER